MDWCIYYSQINWFLCPQVYKGLDIITNKVTPEEQAQVPHHLLDFVDPLSRYSVTDFRDAALPIVERLLSQDKMPVIVGGTNYYIESLLWEVLVDSVSNDRNGKLVYDRDMDMHMGQEGGTLKKLGCDVAQGGVNSGGGERKRKSDERDKEASESGCDEKKSRAEEIGTVESHFGDTCSNETRGDGKEEMCSDISRKNDHEDSSPNNGTEMKHMAASAVGINEKMSTEVNVGLKEDKGGEYRNEKETERGIGKSKNGENGSEKSQGSGEDNGKSGSERQKSGSAREGEKDGLVAWQGTECSTKELYARLWEVDPDIAATYHPNNRRKIIRSAIK